jgi:hypothetical protein
MRWPRRFANPLSRRAAGLGRLDAIASVRRSRTQSSPSRQVGGPAIVRLPDPLRCSNRLRACGRPRAVRLAAPRAPRRSAPPDPDRATRTVRRVGDPLLHSRRQLRRWQPGDGRPAGWPAGWRRPPPPMTWPDLINASNVQRVDPMSMWSLLTHGGGVGRVTRTPSTSARRSQGARLHRLVHS